MFTDHSDVVLDNPVQLNYGIAVSDIDGDGNFEAIVAGFGGPNLVLKWNGSGFDDIASEALADADRQAIGVAAADIDGDGQEEIYVLNTDTYSGKKSFADRLFDYADGGWVDLFELPSNARSLNLIAGRSVACVDRAGTGRYGLFVSIYGGPMRLYELDDDGLLEDVAQRAGTALTTGGRSLLALPLLSERMDIFAGNENGPNFLFRNNGDGTFVDTAPETGLTDPFQNARGVAVVDANGDGRFDLVIGNWEGQHRLYVQGRSGPWHDIATPEFATAAAVRTLIAADFDNDGHDEIFFNNLGQRNRLFRVQDGQIIAIDIGEATEPEGLGTGAAVADFDNDGRLELLIAHGESSAQPLTYYQTPRNANHWLRVIPLTIYGAPARGAVVRLTTLQRTQLRTVDAGSGYLCQMEPVAHFGLGPDPQITQITIHWPDGATETIEAPRADQVMVVPHPRTLNF